MSVGCYMISVVDNSDESIQVVAIEHACMVVPTISVDSTFYLMALSICFGLVAQGFFFAILYNESKQKQFYIGTLGVAFVLVVLSVLSIGLSMLNFETPHTKPTVLVRIVPLSLAIISIVFLHTGHFCQCEWFVITCDAISVEHENVCT